MRPRVILAAVVALFMLGVGVVVPTAFAGSPDSGGDGWATRVLTEPTPSITSSENATPAPPVPAPAPDPAGLLDPSVEVSVDVDGFLAWAARDLTTGITVASDNATETSSTESMIKVWIVADHLRRVAEQGEQPSSRDLEDASLAIRDSHNGTAERLYRAGGRDAVVERMVEICGLADTFTPEGDEGWWSRTQTSARDAVRLGECVVDGRAAGPEWTEWLLEEMRQVRGSTDPDDQRAEEGFEGGRWGIIDGLPEQTVDDGVAIKNGWTRIGRTGSWHLNCLGVTDEWVLAVLMRYPAELPLDYGAQRCASVAEQLIGYRLAAEAVTGAV